jgi:hypothetical protein
MMARVSSSERSGGRPRLRRSFEAASALGAVRFLLAIVIRQSHAFR